MRWLDFDAKYLESNPPPLPENAYLECETWPGEFVVVPSEYARLITSSLELSNLLQCRPRAQVTENFVGANDDDLSVTVSSSTGIHISLITSNDIELTFSISGR